MATRNTAERWLAELANLPTAPGVEDRVVDWVTSWVTQRDDLKLSRDSGGNLFITQRGKQSHHPVLAVAHMDHPAFVLLDAQGSFEFRGGVNPEYFTDAHIHVVSRPDGPTGRVTEYNPRTRLGVASFRGEVSETEVAMWRFRRPRQQKGRFQAPACDDLAGAAAVFAALERARGRPDLRHFGIMLTRAEEMGNIGAVHAAKHGTLPDRVRLISIETSRELPHARIGDGPIIRIGDKDTVFDHTLSNLVHQAADAAGIKYQRRLMDGGGCEASAFGTYGYPAIGMCLALGNYHNSGNLSEVEAGDDAAAVPMLEEISLDDYHGLVDLLLIGTMAVDTHDEHVEYFNNLYESRRHYLP